MSDDGRRRRRGWWSDRGGLRGLRGCRGLRRRSRQWDGFDDDGASVVRETRHERDAGRNDYLGCSVVFLEAGGGNDFAIEGQCLRAGCYDCLTVEGHAQFSGSVAMVGFTGAVKFMTNFGGVVLLTWAVKCTATLPINKRREFWLNVTGPPRMRGRSVPRHESGTRPRWLSSKKAEGRS